MRGDSSGINAAWANTYKAGGNLGDHKITHNGNLEQQKPITWKQLKGILHWAWLQHQAGNVHVVIDIFGSLDEWAEKLASEYPQSSPNIITDPQKARSTEQRLNQQWGDRKDKLRTKLQTIGDPTRKKTKNKAPSRSQPSGHSGKR